jgi:hypothetical protein
MQFNINLVSCIEIISLLGRLKDNQITKLLQFYFSKRTDNQCNPI